MGIQVKGAVLSGEKALGEQRAADAVTAGRADGESYSWVEAYDPALKSHCQP